MSRYQLNAQSALTGYTSTWGDISLAEPKDLAMVSIACSKKDMGSLKKAVQEAFSIQLPTPTLGTVSENGEMRLLNVAPGQYFLLFEHNEANALSKVASKFQSGHFLTDQSDSFTCLVLKGDGVEGVLELICPIDVHLEKFPVGAYARTVIEHIGTQIVRLSEDEFLLFCPRSFAHSFLHTMEEAISSALAPLPE